MKNTLCLIAMVTMGISAGRPAMGADLVFLLGGQSNMLGEGITEELPPPYDQPQSAVQFWENGGWGDLRGGFGYVPTPYRSLFGPEVSFGYRLHQLLPNDNIYLVKYGVDGSSLAERWNPRANDVYPAFKTRANAAMANLIAAGKSPTIAGMIWMQGERDTSTSAMAAAYHDNLTNFITAVRTDFNTPDMAFVVGRILTAWGTEANNTLVRTAQETVPAEVGHASWVNTDDLGRATVGYSDDQEHFGTQGQIDLGIRFADKIVQTPEPATLILVSTGLLCLVVHAWRRRK